MSLKRKRSFSQLSSSPSSATSSPPSVTSTIAPLSTSNTLNSSPCSTPPSLFSFSAFQKLSMAPEYMKIGEIDNDASMRHLNSRTKKRFRNARPAEREVHERTLGMLYAAQHHQPERQQPMESKFQSPTPAVPSGVSLATASPPSPLQQQRHPSPAPSLTRSASAPQASLHSFWNIPNRPALIQPLLDIDMSCSSMQAEQCEDCDAPVSAVDAMDLDGTENYGCVGCRRIVCDTCAVNRDEGRKCLSCTNRVGLGKRWVGGIGWI